MILISPVIAEITDAELIAIQRALERWSGMDDKLAQLIGAVAETGSTFTLATKATIKNPDPFDLAIEDHRNKKENHA